LEVALIRIQTCPNCPGASAREVFACDGARVVRCLSCGLERAERYPDLDQEEARIYPAAYFERAVVEEARRSAIFQELLADLEVRLGRQGRLLDVGAGEGQLVRAALERGWLAEGTDVSSAAVEFMRQRYGLIAHHGEVERLGLPAAAFDVVVMSHALEHVRDPGSTLAAVRERLVPGGLLRVEVPNLAGLSARAKNLQSRFGLKRDPLKHYSTGHHFWFFTPRTLALTIEAAGFERPLLLAPARQWGVRGGGLQFLNAVYQRFLWGGHAVAFARRPESPRKGVT
jgi:2-polyprenyl-3-methyl-5-hydroxy-6-metoxy-1,4-benzoquinol methylase